ncbi:hypothetical protein PPL_03499 (plasmid) [Heterostelium pallidum]|uniref:Uncharacterized protein n=1 Tax=Heterostelium pallidum (strain ATCC 26659 / Pp 5 / PN500) TaxID=670386 RepID=D3EMQ7_HETP5|nr:hypothetical protein PPL_03499 [Heterostelium pallidum]ADC31706.1 hypothetical protein PPL_03499 [Heterostelium pallidum]|eukprot:YP_003422570.1 hypothetical protein PPL_03499 (plasmid) [Heterostelium pallidum]
MSTIKIKISNNVSVTCSHPSNTSQCLPSSNSTFNFEIGKCIADDNESTLFEIFQLPEDGSLPIPQGQQSLKHRSRYMNVTILVVRTVEFRHCYKGNFRNSISCD